MEDNWRKEDKLLWLSEHAISDLPFEHIQPDKDHNWLHLTDNDWDSYVGTETIFKLISLGVSTNRDDWVFDFDNNKLESKMKYFVSKYNELLSIQDDKDTSIKWSDSLKHRFQKNTTLDYIDNAFIEYHSRPFIKTKYYSDKPLSDRLTQNHYDIFGANLLNDNRVIAISGVSSSKPFSSLVSSITFSLDLLEKTQCLPLYRHDKDGNRHDNITDWALGEFIKQYTAENITKEDIFHYVYGVLHNPAYRTKYEQNLKRSLPRIPYYEDFWQWAEWGQQLMALHIGFETAEPYPLEICNAGLPATGNTDFPATGNTDFPATGNTDLQSVMCGDLQSPTQNPGSTSQPQDLLHSSAHIQDKSRDTFTQDKSRGTFQQDRHPALPSSPKPKLKADKEQGIIILDEDTTLSGIPHTAWQYKLGNRSALEWILDQYKEKKPKDPTIARLFNTYRFADYKDKVIDLLLRVTTVSVETMKIVREMEHK